MTALNIKVRPRETLGITIQSRKSFITSKDGVVIGDPGLSAYEVAVKNGFVGTEAEWLVYISQNHDHDVGNLVLIFENGLV